MWSKSSQTRFCGLLRWWCILHHGVSLKARSELERAKHSFFAMPGLFSCSVRNRIYA